MHSLVFGGRFLNSAKKLEEKLKLRLKKNLDSLSDNPFHLYLHTKPLTGELRGLYSFRLGRDFRVIFKFLDNKEIHLIDITHRKDIYR